MLCASPPAVLVKTATRPSEPLTNPLVLCRSTTALPDSAWFSPSLSIATPRSRQWRRSLLTA